MHSVSLWKSGVTLNYKVIDLVEIYNFNINVIRVHTAG